MRQEKQPLSQIAFLKLQSELQQPRSKLETTNLLTRLSEELTWKEQDKLSELIAEEKLLKKLPLKWKGTNPYKNLICANSSPNPFLLALALYPEATFSFNSALSLLGFLEMPKSLHLVKERNRPQPERPLKLSDDLLLDQFSKPPRHTNRVARYQQTNYVLLEREYSKNLGVTTKWKEIENRTWELKVTDLERTILDACLTPQYVGSATNLFEFFEKTHNKINIDILRTYYSSLKCRYPYWQRIGFLLDTVDAHSAKCWRDTFGTPKYKFFLDKGYQQSWHFDSKWKIYYPHE